MGIIEQYDPRKGKQFQILDKTGKIVSKKYEPKFKKEQLRALYEYMVLMRHADDKALKLQRSGRMGTFAQCTGQEAQVAVGLAMQQKDWLFPSFRENAVMLIRGMPLENFYMVFMGNEQGNNMPKNVNVFPISVPVGSQVLHAAGVAWGAKIKKDSIVTVGFLGDGGTSEGDFHEAMNFCGVYKLPCVIVCQNNQYAISLSRDKQTASKTIAEKAFAYGFNGIQVDGNDPLALYVVTKEAVENARKGKGPTFIESNTYRLAPHTTSDDPGLYRSKKEEEKMKLCDPILRMRAYLKKKKMWTSKYEKELVLDVEKRIETAVKKAENNKPKPEDIFNYTFENLPEDLKEQSDYLKKVIGK